MTRIAILYLLGLLQGISFTLIPGASGFLTDRSGFALSSSQYGDLFIPMVIGAVLASFFGGGVARQWGIRNVTIISCLINLLSMLIFAMSALFLTNGLHILLLTMTFLGIGFGSNLTTLNSYILEFFKSKQSAALTALHATLGIGTALGPLLFDWMFQMHVWWFSGILLGSGYFMIMVGVRAYFPKTLDLPMARNGRLKKGVWVFIVIACLYGISETAFGNWTILYLKQQRDVSLGLAALCLSIFWASVTIGRGIASALSTVLQPKWIYGAIGFLLISSLFILSFSDLIITPFVVAGLGCSAFLPMTVSFAQKQDLAHAEFISGLVIALYMCGYGMTAFGVAWLITDYSFSLSHLFIWLMIPVGLIASLALRNINQTE